MEKSELKILVSTALSKVLARPEWHLRRNVFAAEAEISNGFLTQLANGIKAPSGNTLEKLASVSGMTLQEFLASGETTGDGYHEIGEVWAGEKMELTYNPQIPIDIVRYKDTTILQTGGGQRWTYENFEQKGWALTFIEDVNTTMFASIEKVHNARKASKPFFVDLKPYDTYDHVLFVHTQDWKFRIDGKDKRPGVWVVMEEK